MSKEKRMPKEYAIVVSLMIFFTIVILVGTLRIYLITKYEDDASAKRDNSPKDIT